MKNPANSGPFSTVSAQCENCGLNGPSSRVVSKLSDRSREDASGALYSGTNHVADRLSELRDLPPRQPKFRPFDG
jgi:hypothetical protein